MAIVVVMYIESVPNRNSPPCTLLRESYRHGGKVRKRTLANLTQWPPEVVAGLRALIKGGKVSFDGDFEIERSLPHGHVAAALGVLRGIGLHKIIASRRCRQRDLAVAMIVARVIDPRSKLATARGLSDETAFTSLGEALGLGEIDENGLYAAMDWLLARQKRIEAALAGRHLHDGTLVLYDLSSSYFEGKTCPLAKLGYSRDGKKGTLQIVYGLLCDVEGRPIAIEVFEGNTGDPATLASQVDKIRNRFGLARVVLVGDRGMITEARIREDLDDIEGLNWITALRGPAIRDLVKAGHLQPLLFDDEDPAAGRALQASPAAPAQRSPAAKRKAAAKRTDDDKPVHSFQTVLADLATIAKNRIQPSVPGAESFEKITRPTSNQQRILDLLGVSV